MHARRRVGETIQAVRRGMFDGGHRTRRQPRLVPRDVRRTRQGERSVGRRRIRAPVFSCVALI